MKTYFSLSVMAACLTFVGLAKAQNYAIDWFKIDGGGGTSTGGVFSVSGTLGQPDAGPAMTGGPYSLAGGFWSFVGAMETPPPPLAIERTMSGVRVLWPLPAAGAVLDESMALSSPPAAISWSQVPSATYQTNATHIFISVAMPAGNRFYRLRR